MKDFFKKLNRQQDTEDLDTGYDSDYYGGSYNRQAAPAKPAPAYNESRGNTGYGYDRYDEYDRGAQQAQDTYARTDARDGYGYDRGYREEPPRDYREPVTYQPAPAPTPQPVEPEVKAPENAGTLYFVPNTYKDCREAVVAGLVESHVVVVNIKNLDNVDARRLFDYITGAVQVLEADMTRLNATALLLAPKDLEVTEDDLRSLMADKEDTDTEEDDDAEEETEAYDYLSLGLPDEDMDSVPGTGI